MVKKMVFAAAVMMLMASGQRAFSYDPCGVSGSSCLGNQGQTYFRVQKLYVLFMRGGEKIEAVQVRRGENTKDGDRTFVLSILGREDVTVLVADIQRVLIEA